MNTTRATSLQLYKNLLRGGQGFKTWNFRQYISRRTREEFRKHQHETNPATIELLQNKARQNLVIVKRQALINSIYANDDSVMTSVK